MSRATPHREYLELAAAGMDGLLDAEEQARLVAHLSRCDVCRTRVAGYEDDRRALRQLRAAAPPPPRDLWARTSAALDGAAVGAPSMVRPATTAPSRWVPLRSARGAYAAALAALVVVAVVGSGIVPGLLGPGASFVATATPLAVEPGVIAYVSTRDGDVGVYMGRISKVCPEGFVTNCAPIERDVRKVASLTPDFVAQQLSVSPDGKEAALVATSAAGSGVYAVRFPELPGPPEPTPVRSAAPTPTGSAKPTGPTETVGPTVSVLPSANGRPEAIIDHVVIVGEPPAYSADGTMLAFSAMPVDGDVGPDIYVWRGKDQKMDRLTSDGDSIFASWAGTAVVGSRGEPAKGESDAATATPVSFVVDPATGDARTLARPAWRPVVDPLSHEVIYWDGTLERADGGRMWQEERGGLYVAPWRLFDPTAAPLETPAPSSTATPTPVTKHGQPTQRPTGTPTTTPAVKADASPGASPGDSPTSSASSESEPVSLFPGRDYDADPILSWEARWSPDGETFGAWISDGAGGAKPEAGSLTVGSIDPATGGIDPERYQLKGAPAVRDFALGDHRIAWTTVADPDGKSEVRVLAWTDTGRGLVRTTPGGNDSLPAL